MCHSIIIHTSSEGYSIEHFAMMVETATEIQHNTNMLSLTFIISNDLNYEIAFLPPGKICHDQYNLVHVPIETFSKFVVKQKGTYSAVNIHFTSNYLQQYITEFPNIERLLKHMNFPRMASRANLPITKNMRVIIQNILSNKQEGLIRDNYMDTQVKDLVFACLKHIQTISPILAVSHPQNDIDKIIQVHDYLLKGIEKSCSVSMLASRVDLDEKRLETVFKHVYGTTVFDFHLGERMRVAKDLLIQTKMPVSDIAKMVGYQQPNSFSLVFKKKCGYSPRSFRQNLVK